MIMQSRPQKLLDQVRVPYCQKGTQLVVRGLLGAASGGIAAASLGLLGSMYEGESRSPLQTRSIQIAKLDKNVYVAPSSLLCCSIAQRNSQ